MKTQELFSILEQNQDKSLLFEYIPNAFVGANYHITEVKHITINSVDCGAQTDNWNETIIQLWESPSEIGKTDFMSVYKALGILNKVGKMKPYDLNAEVKFEYSNKTFHTAQLFVSDFTIENNKLIIKLSVEQTDCKAKEACGVPDQKKELVTNDEPCCSPSGNCC
ncbi:DUF6428 family protein [uncultured Psychroserpens sp.]|uniref:DUF6428 family protein n=1 Tax=uncultured Psychroserpens sp. TaxID=255436 RepID=UPI0026341603|nr:DUF6428 family protein [uncultured Psychroserpens sp.]